MEERETAFFKNSGSASESQSSSTSPWLLRPVQELVVLLVFLFVLAVDGCGGGFC